MAAIPGCVQLVTDNFNRADQNPIAGNWTDDGHAIFKILSNSVTVVNPAQDGAAIWNTWASGKDQYSQAEITVGSFAPNSGMGVCVRHDPTIGTNTLYRLYMANNGAWSIDRITSGSVVSIRGGSTTYVAGTVLGLLITGSTLQAYYGGAPLGTSIDDTLISSGVPGLAYSSTITTPTLDNWEAGIPALGAQKLALKPAAFKPAFVRR